MNNNNNEIQSIIDTINSQKNFDIIFFKNLSTELRNNYDIVFTAVSNYPYSLELASKELKNNYEIVLTAVSNDGYALEFASKKLQNNYEVVLSAVSSFGESLQYASKELKNNYEIVLAAVSNCSSSLAYASPELRNNKDIVLVAVAKDAFSFQYASDELQNNLETLRVYKKFHELPKNHISNYDDNDYQQFYDERIKALNILEEQDWLDKNVHAHLHSNRKIAKF